MFDRARITKAVELQEKSYALFQWLNERLKSGRLDLSKVHGAISMAQAAEDWIGRNVLSFPPACRPERKDIPAFASLFSSYLATSYQVATNRVVSECGCYCEWCAYILSFRHLRVRTPSKKAYLMARNLKRIALRTLAEELKAPCIEDDFDAMVEESSIASDLSWVTYGQELIRRLEFGSQGEGVLVLWREIAWDEKGRMRKRFRLSADAFLRAEARLKDCLKHVYELTEGMNT